MDEKFKKYDYSNEKKKKAGAFPIAINNMTTHWHLFYFLNGTTYRSKYS